MPCPKKRAADLTEASRFPNRRDDDSYVDAPYGNGFLAGMSLIGCFHMSGLFVRRCDCRWP